MAEGLLGAYWGRVGVGNRWETTVGGVFDNITDLTTRINHSASDTRAQESTSDLKDISGAGAQGATAGAKLMDVGGKCFL